MVWRKHAVFSKVMWKAVLVVTSFLQSSSGSQGDFHILGIPVGSDMDAVKAAYRKEALRWHPDQNKDDPGASDIFIKVTKAYENLKAELSREKRPEAPQDPLDVFKDFMGSSFSFSFSSSNVRLSGTSSSTSTTIRNGKRITKTVVKDLATGATESTITEEDLQTGRVETRRVSTHNSIEL